MSDSEQVWVVDDDRSIRWVLERALQKADIAVSSFETGSDLLAALQQNEPDAIITDIRMPGLDGLELLERIHSSHPNMPVIIITAHSDLDSAVSAYQGGAFEYLPKPFDVNDAVDLARRACERHRQNEQQHAPKAVINGPEIIGEAPAMQEVFRAIGRLSRSNITVLINGESGTGKELVAHALHKHSPRAERTFIALNTAAIPKDLLESELFGHEKGAFTGAQSLRRGRFEQAHGGTLFLDEIGDMPAELQTRLLRVLADGEFYRVGGHTPVKADVRIIAATHQNLEQRVKDSLFREDLFHRLNVIRIHVPALRERREDIPLLLDFFLTRAAKELDAEQKVLKPDVERFLSQQEWPGNVRQLENFSRWLTVMASGREVIMEDLPPELQKSHETIDCEPETGREATAIIQSDDWQTALENWGRKALESGKDHILDSATPMFERTMIRVALEKTGGRRQEAAKLLGWGRNTLTRKINELEMDA